MSTSRPDAETERMSEHVRPPRQGRSRRTLQRLERAALEIISREGVQAATVSRIVERAGSSVGSFYARFEGKEALLLHLERRVWDEARRRWEEAARSQPWEELALEGVVRSVVRLLARVQREDADTRKALGQGAVRDLGEEGRAFHRDLEDEVARLLLLRRDEMSHPQPELAVRIAYRWALGGMRELLDRSLDSEEHEGPLESAAADSERIVEEVARGVSAYLAGETGPEKGEGEVEFFDVWQ